LDFENGGIPRQTFHLQHVLQANPPQDTAESFLGLEARQFMKGGIDGSPAAFVPRFLQEQFGAVGQAGGAMAICGVSGQHDLEHVGIFALKQAEELKPSTKACGCR
jgi:hypothetical protein